MEYDYQLKNEKLSFEEGVEQLYQKFSDRVIIGAINNTDPDCILHISSEIQNSALTLKEFRIDCDDYSRYVKNAEYTTRYPRYYTDNFYEKSLEHYICFHLLNLQNDDKFIDIASEHSPVGDIFSRLTGCISYSQDIMYEKGIHHNRIGSDVSDIPVPDNFFKAAIATCSIEHFENDSDIGFMKEMERVLEITGKCIIIPLYMFTRPSCQTDPRYSIPGKVTFDEDTDIYCAKDWGNRHGRFYSASTLLERLIRPNKKIKFGLYLITNPNEIDRSVYCRFFLMGERI
jgi:hypothetical protein